PCVYSAETAGLLAAVIPTRRNRSFHFCGGVADQRRKQGWGAKPTMRRYDPPYRFRCWCVIEQNVATAVDLQVDKAWRQPDALRQFRHGQTARKLGARHNALDSVIGNDDGGIAVRDRAIEDAARGDRVRLAARFGAHRVRVTFCKCRGRSASVPRCAASLISKA